MKQKDHFMPIIRNNVAPRFVNAFSKNILRPNNTFTYRAATLPSATPFVRRAYRSIDKGKRPRARPLP